ncbi:unnamed protein product, partial [Mesorhabditis spiculigera]
MSQEAPQENATPTTPRERKASRFTRVFVPANFKRGRWNCTDFHELSSTPFEIRENVLALEAMPDLWNPTPIPEKVESILEQASITGPSGQPLGSTCSSNALDRSNSSGKPTGTSSTLTIISNIPVEPIDDDDDDDEEELELPAHVIIRKSFIRTDSGSQPPSQTSSPVPFEIPAVKRLSLRQNSIPTPTLTIISNTIHESTDEQEEELEVEPENIVTSDRAVEPERSISNLNPEPSLATTVATEEPVTVEQENPKIGGLVSSRIRQFSAPVEESLPMYGIRRKRYESYSVSQLSEQTQVAVPSPNSEQVEAPAAQSSTSKEPTIPVKSDPRPTVPPKPASLKSPTPSKNVEEESCISQTPNDPTPPPEQLPESTNESADEPLNQHVREAIDLVKHHVDYIVTQQITGYKKTIKELKEKEQRLEAENAFFRTFVPDYILEDVAGWMARGVPPS